MDDSLSSSSSQDMSLDQRLSRAMHDIRELLRGVDMSNSSTYLASVSQLYATNRVMAQEYARINSVGDKKTAAVRLGDVVDKSIQILYDYRIPKQLAVYIIKKLDTVQASDRGG